MCFLLYSLAEMYEEDYDPDQVRSEAIEAYAGVNTAPLLKRDWQVFQQKGLDHITPARRQGLLEEYRAINEPAALEVAAWLAGEYLFDPACLTG